MVLAEPDLGWPAPLCTGWAKNVYRLRGYRSIHHQEQKHILKGINMKTNQNEKNTRIDKLSKLIKRLGGQDKEIEEMISKINSEPRDLRKPFKDPIIIPGEITFSEKPLKTNKSYELKAYNNGIQASFGNFKETPEGIDITISSEEVESFIDALIQACDVAFPE
jgi:hypothetical protein